jgi:hypothetical protein
MAAATDPQHVQGTKQPWYDIAAATDPQHVQATKQPWYDILNCFPTVLHV